MADIEVVESFHNAWIALEKQYARHPDEAIRCAMNLLAKIIGKAKAEVKKAHKEEWMRRSRLDGWAEHEPRKKPHYVLQA